MKFTRKRILITLWVLVVFAVCCAFIDWALFYDDPAIKCTLEWGRLSTFPDSAQQLTTTTTGGMFTRGFRVSFIASPADIEEWLQLSPGTSDTTPTTPSPGVRHFEIKPGGGAQHAEVTVDDTQHRVSIYVYWS